MKSPRILNEYRVVYKPNNPSSMKNKCWDGYIYEHILVAEQELGRQLLPNEVVHHLNGDKKFNLRHNLIVLDKKMHAILHRNA